MSQHHELNADFIWMASISAAEWLAMLCVLSCKASQQASNGRIRVDQVYALSAEPKKRTVNS